MKVLLAVLVTALVVGGGMAAANPPSSDGVSHLCFVTRDAARLGGADVNLIEPGQGGNCKPNQTMVSIAEASKIAGLEFESASLFARVSALEARLDDLENQQVP